MQILLVDKPNIHSWCPFLGHVLYPISLLWVSRCALVHGAVSMKAFFPIISRIAVDGGDYFFFPIFFMCQWLWCLQLTKQSYKHEEELKQLRKSREVELIFLSYWIKASSCLSWDFLLQKGKSHDMFLWIFLLLNAENVYKQHWLKMNLEISAAKFQNTTCSCCFKSLQILENRWSGNC